MPLVEQLFQRLDPVRQLRAPLAVGQAPHLPELLLRMADVQRQDRPAEQATAPLLQAFLAIEDDLNGLLGPGRETAARGLVPRPLQRPPAPAARPEALAVQA